MADAPEKIWAGSCAALGAPDTGFWYPVRTPSTPTPYIRADLVDDLRKAAERFNRGGITLFGNEEDVPITFKGKDFQALRAALARIDALKEK